MADTYRNYDHLVQYEREGEDFSVVVHSGSTQFMIVIPHGGGIEPGTSEIGTLIAGDEHGMYLFEGLKANGNRDLHITSVNFDEKRLLAAIRGKRVMAIHGLDNDSTFVEVGGLDSKLCKSLESALQEDGIEVRPCRHGLQGLEPRNICNQGLGNRGVQLEIGRGIRQNPALRRSLAEAVRSALAQA